jgi:hypothetical protein
VVEKIDKKVGSSLSDHYIRIYKADSSLIENELISGAGLKLYKDGILI